MKNYACPFHHTLFVTILSNSGLQMWAQPEAKVVAVMRVGLEILHAMSAGDGDEKKHLCGAAVLCRAMQPCLASPL